MSEAKFTPGPWSIRRAGPHWNNPELCNIEINYGTDTECVCDTVYEMEDARLIAKSPAMYEFIHRLIDDSQLDIGWREEAEKLLAECRGET